MTGAHRTYYTAPYYSFKEGGSNGTRSRKISDFQMNFTPFDLDAVYTPWYGSGGGGTFVATSNGFRALVDS